MLTASGGWQPAAPTDFETREDTVWISVLRTLGRLVVGAVGWVALMALALFLGFLQGRGTVFIGAGLLAGLAIAWWALYPLVRLLFKK